jgi:aspartate/methionine/tyrosine aminotransferase
VKIAPFEMERYQSLYWHLVDYDLSESGVLPMTIRELLGPTADAEGFLHTALGYPLSEGSLETRAGIAAWYPGVSPEQVSLTNGGSEANFLALFSLLEPGDRLAFMVPNYMQGKGLGKLFGKRTDTFRLKPADGRWALDLEGLDDAVGKKTKVIMVCNPNNPTGSVLTEAEMDAVVRIAERRGAWIVADEIYRGAEVDTDVTTPTFWGRYDKVVITSGLSKAFALPGLRVGWVVGSTEVIGQIQAHHDYTTLAPGMVSDRLAALAMLPEVRESIIARTRTIIRTNYPQIERWLASHGDVMTWTRPVAGAIVYAHIDLPITSRVLVERLRTEQSVLLVPGEMFGLKKGIRFGYGFDIDATMKGLARVDETLAQMAAGA